MEKTKERKNSENIVPMNDVFCESDTKMYNKTFMFLKGFAFGLDLRQTSLALSLARLLHEGQYRADGETPYILHPLKVCSTLVSYGIKDDIILAAALLHDVLEECSEKISKEELINRYGVSKEVVEIIQILSKKSGLDEHALSIYFKRIEDNPRAALIKLSDRLHNSATLYALSYKRIQKYIKETDTFIIPMCSFCKSYYPEYANIFTILKNNIVSLNNVMKVMIEKDKNLEDDINRQGENPDD